MKKFIKVISLVLIPLIILSTAAVTTYAAESKTQKFKTGSVVAKGKGGEPTGGSATLTPSQSIISLSLNGKNSAYLRITPGGSYPSNYTISNGYYTDSDYQSVTWSFQYWDGDSAVYLIKGISVGIAHLYFELYDGESGSYLTETDVYICVYKAGLTPSPKKITVNLSGTNSAQLRIKPTGFYSDYFAIYHQINNPNIAEITFKRWDNDTAIYNIKGLRKGTATMNFQLLEDMSGGDVVLANVSVSVNVIKQSSQKITCKSSFTKQYGASAFSLGAKAKTKLTYSSSDKKVATVSSSGKVTVKGCGKAVITIKAKATSSYKAATKKVTILVKPGKVNITKKSMSGNFLTMKFSPQKNCTGYKLQISTSSNYPSGSTVSTDLSGTAKGVKIKLSTGYYYYIRIRAYKKVGGKTYYGAWRTTNLFA